ncbi:uncharacterized protein LOC116849389 isoform X2 [Odontomachus brunneus]|uniref:uncharacterized protein LOC116849389 isoform X2 n=1 Tax=Odontomachus brunneus TaxID=486640 RepID=UPI0013F227FD|nr:uncharacterized protein LOC116849389 isoform X2 [Odontomachus brunneus]
MTRREDRQNQLLADLALSSNEDAPIGTVDLTPQPIRRVLTIGTRVQRSDHINRNMAHRPSATNTKDTEHEQRQPATDEIARKPGTPRTSCRQSLTEPSGQLRRNTGTHGTTRRRGTTATGRPSATSRGQQLRRTTKTRVTGPANRADHQAVMDFGKIFAVPGSFVRMRP